MTLDDAKTALKNGALFGDVYNSVVLTCYNDGLSTPATNSTITELRRFFCHDLPSQERWQAGSKKADKPQSQSTRKIAKEQGFEGDPCTTCGALQVVRNGSCLLCRACGTTTGCS